MLADDKRTTARRMHIHAVGDAAPKTRRLQVGAGADHLVRRQPTQLPRDVWHFIHCAEPRF